jgi:hypothetical protein
MPQVMKPEILDPGRLKGFVPMTIEVFVWPWNLAWLREHVFASSAVLKLQLA